MMERFLRRSAAIAASSGVAVFLINHFLDHPRELQADTAFVRPTDVAAELQAARRRYHLVNHFWLPVQVQLQLAPGPDPQQVLPQFFTPQAHLTDDVDLIAVPINSEEVPSLELAFDTVGALGSAATLFHHGYSRKIGLKEAIDRARRILQRHREEIGSPGLVIGVSINGQVVWSEGLGYADLENQVECRPETVMRIASIGKAISMTIVSKLWENGLLDLDKPIQEYVPDFPLKTFNGESITITCRHLVSHLSGIRHYSKTRKRKGDDGDQQGTAKKESLLPEIPATSTPTTADKYNEFDEKEYYIREPYGSVADSLKLFKDDPLLGKTGEEYLYTTHGWTLLCAVIEAVTKRKITDCLRDLFRDLGLQQTFLDEHEPIVYNRSRNYRRDKAGRLKNAPYVDNSYKWAGGGLLSTVGDLLTFAHVLLRSYQWRENDAQSGYLKPTTMKSMWTLVDKTKKNEYAENGYGMGWMVVPERVFGSWCWKQPHVAYHSGGAIGASSVLVIIPCTPSKFDMEGKVNEAPQGIVVTIITNLEQAALYKKALEVAHIFDQVKL